MRRKRKRFAIAHFEAQSLRLEAQIRWPKHRPEDAEDPFWWCFFFGRREGWISSNLNGFPINFESLFGLGTLNETHFLGGRWNLMQIYGSILRDFPLKNRALFGLVSFIMTTVFGGGERWPQVSRFQVWWRIISHRCFFCFFGWRTSRWQHGEDSVVSFIYNIPVCIYTIYHSRIYINISICKYSIYIYIYIYIYECIYSLEVKDH